MANVKMTGTVHRHGFQQEAGRFVLSRLKTFLAAAFCLLVCFVSGAADFTASLDRDTITLGESATLTLTFTGAQPHNAPTPNVPGLQIVNTGNSQNFSYNNGQMNSVVSVTYSITPQQTGEFTIPAMTVDAAGEQLSTQPLKLTVQKSEAPSNAQINSGTQIAFMRMVLPQKKVYPGQVLTGQLQVFYRDDVQQSEAPQLTAEPTDGFIIGKMTPGQQQRTPIGNRVYTVVPFAVQLTATKSGTLSLGPISASVVILTGAERNFFGLVGGQQQRIAMTTDPVTVESLPLPVENVPASFNGAIGDYTMKVTAGPTKVAVGDPITVHVDISGRGAPDSITLPNQPGWNDFKIFSPTSKIQLVDELGNQGTKSFEEIVTPQNAGVHELPPFSFSFFNPDDGTYHTLTQPATPLFVTATGATPLPTVAAGRQTENQPPPQDVVPIRENLGAIAPTGTPLVLRPTFVALQSVPVIAFLAALIWRKRTDNLANNPRLRRQRAVAQLIAGGLTDLNKFAAENKSNEFFAMLFRLLQEQLGERLDCPAISITEADVDARLAALGANQETVNSLRELFHACNQARYAPVQTSQELSALASKFKKTVAELQDLKV